MTKRHWGLDLEGRSFLVELDHTYLSGRIRLRADGEVVLDRRPRSVREWLALTALPAEHSFALGGRELKVRVEPGAVRYGFDLVVDGRSVRTGMPATPPPWETSPSSPVSLAASLFAAAMASVSLPAFAFWYFDLANRTGWLILGIALVVTAALVARGIRARVRTAWYGALFMGPAFLIGFTTGFVRSITGAPTPSPDVPDWFLLAVRVWSLVNILLFGASTVALLRASVRREFAFASAPPLNTDARPASA